MLLLAWTSKRIFGSLFSALEAVFEVKGRGFFRGNLMSFTMVFVTGIAMIATLALALVVAAAQGFVLRFGVMGSGTLHSLEAFFFTQALPVLITLSFFFIVYRVVPHRVMRSRHALVGAALATVLWEAAKTAFAWYVRNLTHYAGLYGTLEGVIVLALWLEVSVSIILYCGEVVALLIRTPEA